MVVVLRLNLTEKCEQLRILFEDNEIRLNMAISEREEITRRGDWRKDRVK